MKKVKMFTAEEQKEFIDLIAAGKDSLDLARRFGMSSSAAYGKARKLGLKIKFRKGPVKIDLRNDTPCPDPFGKPPETAKQLETEGYY